jgi:O-antigen/teichoic acid export membrane protein
MTFGGRLARMVRTDRQAVGTIASNLAIALFLFLVGVLLARFLGVEGRGRFAAHYAVLGIAFNFGGLGLNYAAAFVGARSGGSSVVWLRILRLTLLAVVLTGLLDVAAEGAVVRSGSVIEVVWAMTGAVLTQIASIILGWIQGSRSLALWNRLRLLQAVSYFTFVLLTGLYGLLTVAAALAAYAASNFVTSLAAFLLAGCRGAASPSDAEVPTVRAIWHYAGAVAVSSSLYQLNQRLDQIFLTLFRRTADLGVYASAVQLAGVASPLVAGMAQATYGESLHLGAVQRTELMRRRVRIALAGAALGAVVLTLFSGRFMTAVYGRDFASGAAPLAILSWGAVLLGGNYVAADSLRGGGNSRAPMRAAIAAAVVTVLLLPVAIWRFGIVGAACAVALASAVTFGMNYASARRLGRHDGNRH